MVSLRKLFEYKKACCLFVAAIMVALGAQASASIPAQQVYSYAKNLDYTALRYLGSSIDNEDSSGNTALCIALAKGDRRAYQTLLQYGANRNARCIARRALAEKRMAMASGSSQTFLGMGTTGWLVTGALVAGGIGIAAASGGGGGGGSGGGSGKPQCDGYQQVCPAGYHATEDTCQIGDQTLYKCEPDTCEGYVISCPDGYHPNGEMCRAGDIVMHKCSLNTCSGYVEACPVGYEETDDTCTSGDVLLKKCRAQKCLGYNINTNPLDNPNMHCTDTSSCLSGTEYRYKCNACEKGWVSSDCSKPYQCGDNFKLACVEYDGWVPTGQVCLSGDTEYYGCEPKDCTGYNIPAGTETEHCADLERCKSGDNPATYKCTKCEEGYNFGPDGTCQQISILCQNLGYSLQECNINTQYVADTDYCPYEENLDDGNKHYHRCSRRQNTHNCTAFDPHADICTECREGWHGEDCMSPNICPAEYTDEKCDNVGWVLDDTCYNGDNPKYKCVPAQCEEGYKAECDEDEYPTDKTCPTGDEIWKECKIRQHSANCGEVDPLHDRCLSCISEEFILNESGYCITLNEECADEGYTSEACPTGQYISSKCELSEEYHKCSRRQNTAQCTEFEPEADICTACETGYGIKDGKCVSNGSLCGSGFKTAACATLEYISEVCEIDESYHKCTRRNNTSGCTAFEDNADRCTECATKYILDEATGTCTSTSSLCPGYSSYISCPALQYKTKCEYDASLLKCVDRTRLVDHCRYYTNPEEDNGVCQTCESGYTVSPDGRTCVEDSGGDDCGDEYSTEDVAGCANYNHCASNYEKKKCTRCNTSRGFIKDPDEYGHCKCSSSSAQIIDNTCVEPETCDDYSTANVTGCYNYIYCPTDSSKKKCNQCDTSKGYKYTPNADGSCSCASATAQIVDGTCVEPETCDDYSTADVQGCYKYSYCPSDSSKKKCDQCNTSKGYKYTPNADGSCSCASATAQIVDGTCVEPDTCEDYSTSDVTGCYKYNYCPTDSSKKKCEQCNTSKGFKYTPNADGSCSCASETAHVTIDGVCIEDIPGVLPSEADCPLNGYANRTCSNDQYILPCSFYEETGWPVTSTRYRKCPQREHTVANCDKYRSDYDDDGECRTCVDGYTVSSDGLSCIPNACEGYSTDNVTGCSIYNYCPTDSTKKKCTACLVYSGYYFNNGTCVYDSCQYDAIVNHWEVCPSATSANKMCTTSSGNTNPEYTGKAFCCPQGTHKDGDTCVADTTKMCPYEADSLNLDYCIQATECDDGSWKCDGCIPTTSHAEAGKPGECIINTVDYCLSAGYETKEALHCQTPAGTACFADGTNYYNQCSTCQSGYDLVNGKCIAQGTRICPYEADSLNLDYCTHATECDDGSWKCDGCIPTTSHAEAGKPGECIINTVAYCLEAGYETKEALHCQTPAGTACFADGTNYYNQCSTCQSGYDLVNGKCVQSGGETECPYTSSDDAIDHYCRTDMTVECSDHSWKCIGCEADSGYELVDGACVPSGGEQECPYTEQPASIYCAHSTQCNDGSWKCDACVPTTAHTEAGKPGECIINTTAYCLEAGYETTEALHCQTPTGTPCIADGTNYFNQCSSCESGYDLVNGKCVEQGTKICPYGATETAPDCATTEACADGSKQCTACLWSLRTSHHISEGRCVTNTEDYCHNEGYKADTEMHCLSPAYDSEPCIVNNKTYYLSCLICEDGYEGEQCETCATGYHPDGDKCVADDPTECTGSQPTPSSFGGYCKTVGCVNGEWKCTQCTDNNIAYNDDSGECIPNEASYCANKGYKTKDAGNCASGITVCQGQAGAQTVDFYAECTSCKENYTKDENNKWCIEQTEQCPYAATDTDPLCAIFEFCAGNTTKRCTACSGDSKAFHIEDGRCIENDASYCESKGQTKDYMDCKTPYPTEPTCVVPSLNTPYFQGCSECNNGEYSQEEKKCIVNYSAECVADTENLGQCAEETTAECSPNQKRCLTCKKGWAKDAEHKCTICDENAGYYKYNDQCILITNPSNNTISVGGTNGNGSTKNIGMGGTDIEGLSLINNGIIKNAQTTSGNFFGMRVKTGQLSNFGSIQSTNAFNISSATEPYAVGMYLNSGTIVNGNGYIINLQNVQQGAIVAGMRLNSGEAKNNGTIFLKNNSIGSTINSSEGVIGILSADQGNITVTNTGDITIEDNNGPSKQPGQPGIYGMYVRGETINSGNIELNGNTGTAIGAYEAYNNITNSGTGTITIKNNTGNVFGIYGITENNTTNSSPVIKHSGTISISNITGNIYGMYAAGNVNNSGGTVEIAINKNNPNTQHIRGIEASGNITNSSQILISSDGDYPNQDVGDNGKYNIQGGIIYGIASDNSNVTNTASMYIGNIKNTGDIYGIYADKTIEHSDGSIYIMYNKTFSDWSRAIYGLSGKNVTNKYNIIIHHNANYANIYGMYINAGGTGKNQGNIEIYDNTNYDNADSRVYGIYVSEGGTVDNQAVIKLLRNYSENQSYGIYCTGQCTVYNTGIIYVESGNGCTGSECAGHDHAIHAPANSIFYQSGSLVMPSFKTFSLGGGTVIATDTSHFEIENEISGDLMMSSDVVTDGFENIYTVENMINAGDVSKLNLLSQSALFDAELKNETDAVLTMKSFDEVVDNQSVADFLKQNYAAGNNEELFNLLKEKDSLVALNAAINALTADDVFNRFNFEDMTMMRELNADVNNKLFNDKSAHLTTSGSIAPFYFESGMGSNARYALYNTRIGRKSVGLSLALSNVSSRDRHDNNSRKDETFQMSVPFGYNRYGFKFITAPRFGYAYGTYDRNGYNHTYDGTVEKRMMGLMNEARYPIDMGGWSLSPAAEFNMLGYHVKGHEDGAPFALNIKSQNNYSVEAGVGLYANKNITLGTNHKLQMRAGVAAYHEFADPYTTELEMQGMNGSFKIRDERRKNQRAVVRAGFDYNFGSDFSLMGAIASYVDGTTHTNANLDFKYHF